MGQRRLLIQPAQRFGRLVVVREEGRHPTSGAITYLCRCDCGNEVVVASIGLHHGATTSCGCLRKERAANAIRARGHGMSNTPTWYTWFSMRQRCRLTTMRCYPRYGGRGISVCERWESFENFLADMGERPEGKTIDRINVNGNYEPSNCRWATDAEQRANRRDSRKSPPASLAAGSQ